MEIVTNPMFPIPMHVLSSTHPRGFRRMYVSYLVTSRSVKLLAFSGIPSVTNATLAAEVGEAVVQAGNAMREETDSRWTTVPIPTVVAHSSTITLAPAVSPT